MTKLAEGRGMRFRQVFDYVSIDPAAGRHNDAFGPKPVLLAATSIDYFDPLRVSWVADMRDAYGG